MTTKQTPSLLDAGAGTACPFLPLPLVFQDGEAPDGLSLPCPCRSWLACLGTASKAWGCVHPSLASRHPLFSPFSLAALPAGVPPPLPPTTRHPTWREKKEGSIPLLLCDLEQGPCGKGPP